MSEKTVSVSLTMPASEAARVEKFIAFALEKNGGVWPETKAGLVRLRQALALALSSDNARSVNGGER